MSRTVVDISDDEEDVGAEKRAKMAALMAMMSQGDDEGEKKKPSKKNKKKAGGKKEEGDASADTEATKAATFEEIEYCPVCGYPPEYCEFSPKFEQCKEWLKDHHPELYPEIFGSASSSSTPSSNSSSTSPANDEKASSSKTPSSSTSEGKHDEGEEKEDEKKEDDPKPAPKATGKKARKEAIAPKVKLSVVNRTKRKHLTQVSGLEGFGVKLSEAAKQMGKRFSCSCAVVKQEGTGNEMLVMQGDFVIDLQDYLKEKYGLKDSDITM
ncbi:putative density-regulated protein [Monocercomonoides exilis]|uniref:putative density-regulated protein n=1 Tax=Monocercomonoides exilis TaxID=2049356 RepID=UPI00355A5F4F|nr:putative density-regulated protein [Monocercomonoides exilis]|eukprot:MONOS_694.1-p1 / transcript=MONOS_694.1 / gene=MONOS_694 / organism=Monocercomonoides_exilis_PA203 / gene_product=density-regulated protein / transcript_product=density-regulated protein / location=Mono_scaffold00011:215702-216839(-) / protein_length=267 / sequence_SO=supercontig / SO=protein_coding / is_pseudo=false